MTLPDYDTEIVVHVLAPQSLQIDGHPVELADLARQIDGKADGRRAKVDVYVSEPREGNEAFLSFLRRVQAELRAARSPVVTGFHINALGAA